MRLWFLLIAGSMFIGTAVFFWLFWQTKPARAQLELKEPSLVVRKKARQLELFDQGKLVKTYKIVLGFEPLGGKIKEGDGRTPEGDFLILAKNPKSKYFLSLGLNYPLPADAERGLRDELISREEYAAILKAHEEKQMPPQKTALGGEIFIHGGGVLWDWTEGCAALKNSDIEEIFAAVQTGTVVKIEP